MIDDVLGETSDSFFSDLGIDAEDLGLDMNDLGEIFDSELEIPEVLSADEFGSVLQAIARSQSDLEDVSASLTEIDDYVDDFEADPKRLEGLLGNIKGIHGELEVCERLNAGNDGLFYALASSTNNPSVDIYGYDVDGNIVRQIQVKMTESPEYIQETLKELPEGVELISGAEMAAEFPGQVLDVGLSAHEVGEDVRTAVEILQTEEPLFNDLATSMSFAEYVRKEGIAFV